MNRGCYPHSRIERKGIVTKNDEPRGSGASEAREIAGQSEFRESKDAELHPGSSF
jgi:hypothetical protein